MTVERAQKRLEKRKQEDGPWLRKYHSMASEIGLDQKVATRATLKFNTDVREPFLKQLKDNIAERYLLMNTNDNKGTAMKSQLANANYFTCN